jgi:Icc-related predicted phosphoesterase
VFFATDLHGSELCFRKFVAAAQFYSAGLLVLGGDLTGKELVLIRRLGVNQFAVRRDGEEVRLNGEGERREFERRCAEAGSYSETVDAEQQFSLSDLDEMLRQAAQQRLQGWVSLANDKFKGADCSVFLIPGNDDFGALDAVLPNAGPVCNVDERVVTWRDSLQVAGLSWSTPTPWKTYREQPEEAIAAALERTMRSANPNLPLVLNVHVPPYGSGLDTAAALDAQLRPVVGPGGPVMQPVGSRAVGEAIRKYQPVLGLFGHAHESRGCVKIGDALCANPGSDYTHGRLLGFLAVVDNGRIQSWSLTEG